MMFNKGLSFNLSNQYNTQDYPCVKDIGYDSAGRIISFAGDRVCGASGTKEKGAFSL
jgi:hypothetical protein